MSPVFPASDVTWFGDDDLQALRALGSRRVIPAGSTLFSEGDEPYDVALIESGEINYRAAMARANNPALIQ